VYEIVKGKSGSRSEAAASVRTPRVIARRSSGPRWAHWARVLARAGKTSRSSPASAAALWATAGGELSAWELRRLRQATADRIRKLVLRGRRDGTFRADHNVKWQLECIYAIVRAGASLTRSEDRSWTDTT